MQIILKAATLFYNNENQVLDAETGNKVVNRAVENAHAMYPSRSIQNAPDWIKNDPTFKKRVKDGSIIIVQTMDIEENDTDETKLIKATDIASKAGVDVNKQDTGWGAKPNGLGEGFSSAFPSK